MGYTLFTNPNTMITACYYVSPLADKLTWANARIACMADGGDLVVIHDDDLNNYILSRTFPRILHSPYFIGLAEPDAPVDAFVYTDTVWLGMRCATLCGSGAAYNMANYMNIDASPVWFLFQSTFLPHSR